MIHDDQFRRMSVERGTIGEDNVRIENSFRLWGNRFCIGAIGLGLVLVTVTVARWILQ